jgi:nicotinamide-nucleotide amidase
MQAQIITIGDEILIGQITDTNSQFLANVLDELGFVVQRMLSIKDDEQELTNNLKLALESADCVIITGGLGPTKDDITKKTLADFFGSRLIESAEVKQQVEKIFARFGKEIPPASYGQYMIPANCVPLRNENGTAPGMWFATEKGQIVVSLPGVPIEMKALAEKEVIPRLKSYFKLQFNLHRTILTVGVGESDLMQLITTWENELEDKGIKLAYLPNQGRVRLRLSMRGNNKEKMEEMLEHEVERLYHYIPKYIYGEEETDLAEAVGELLKEQGKSLSTAESCTGGYIAHRITSFAGSSAYFKGSVVSYHNDAKMDLLGVKKSDIQKHGAVSQEVVEAMALNAKKTLKTDYAISVSGIAGPDGGTESKPVGTAWIAIAGPDGFITSKLFSYGTQRKQNIFRATNAALNMLRKQLLK